MVPAQAAVFVSTDAGLRGHDRKALGALTRRLTGAPDARSFALRFARRLGSVSYERDIAPWLGDRIGVFAVAGRGGASLDWGVVAEARDRTAATETLRRLTRTPGGPATASYRGSAYAYARGLAVGVVGDWMVVGSERALRAALDARRGNSLDDSAAFGDAVAAHERRGAALVYVEPRSLTIAALGALGIGASARPALADRLGVREPLPLAGTIGVSKTAITVSARPRNGCLTGTGANMRDEPPDSWLVAELPSYGLGQRSCFLGDVPHPRGAVVLRSGTAEVLDLDRDFLRWFRPSELVARGEGTREVSAELRGTVADPVGEAEALPRLGGSLAYLPGVSASFRAVPQLAGSNRILDVRAPSAVGAFRVSADEVQATIARIAPRGAPPPPGAGLDLGLTPDYADAVRRLGRARRPALFLRPRFLARILRELGLPSPGVLQRIEYLASGAPIASPGLPGRSVRLVVRVR